MVVVGLVVVMGVAAVPAEAFFEPLGSGLGGFGGIDRWMRPRARGRYQPAYGVPRQCQWRHTHLAQTKAQVDEDDSSYVVSLALPEVLSRDVRVTPSRGRLDVVAVRRPYRGCEAYQRAQRYEKTFQLPMDTPLGGIRADLRDGVLYIVVPKAQRGVREQPQQQQQQQQHHQQQHHQQHHQEQQAKQQQHHHHHQPPPPQEPQYKLSLAELRLYFEELTDPEPQPEPTSTHPNNPEVDEFGAPKFYHTPIVNHDATVIGDEVEEYAPIILGD